jgi:hypothetical protein
MSLNHNLKLSRLKNKSTRKISAVFIAALLASMLITDRSFCGVEYQGTAEASRKNALGGYDYYDKKGKRVGYSIPNRSGGFDYYDASGNKIGTLSRKEGDKSYIFYDGDKIRKGSLKRGATGTYSYRDIQRGTSTESATQLRTEVGSLSPETFQGDASQRR